MPQLASPIRSRPVFPSLLAATVALCAAPALAQSEAGLPTCYATGGTSLEICRSNGEPEGVFYATPSCRFVYDVQILRLKTRGAPGPLQVVFHAEPGRETERGEDACAGDLRATDPATGGSVRSGRQVEQLATIMPPTEYRFTGPKTRSEQDAQEQRGRRGRGRERAEEREARMRAAAAAPEGSAGRDPMTVAGRDWAGDDYHYIFMVAYEMVGQSRRRVLVQGRTLDFESLEVRGRAEDSDTVEWLPFAAPGTLPGRQERRQERRRRARREARPPAPPALAAVTDETAKPITGNCAAPGFEPRGLVGSISVVNETYYYFYTDVLPTDCGAAPDQRRMGLYLRTSRNITVDRAWSPAQLLVEGLPPDTLMRVGKARAMERGADRWVIAYSCYRPANAPGGPVADICLHYAADLTLDAIKAVPFFAEPSLAARSPAYLGLRIGGDGSGSYGRDGFFWMTDRYGNLDAPAVYPEKGGFLTWLDRTAPRADGSDGSSLYGRPVYWSTWTVRRR